MSWDSFKVGKKRKKVWQAGPPCLFWMVWKTRNGMAFRDDTLSI